MSIAMDVGHLPSVARSALNPFSATFPISALNGAMKVSAAPDDLQALHQIGVKARFASNETIFNEGDEATHCYKIVSGAVRVCKHMADGRRQIAGFLLAGDFFGFMQPNAYSFTAEAVSAVVLTCYPRRQLELLSSEMPSIRKRFLFLLSQRLSGMQDHLVMLGRQTAKERVASFLLLLAERSDAEEDASFDVPMTRQDMADYLGLTIETVSRVLSDLKRARIIDMPAPHQIVLTDIEALHSMADGED